MYANVARLQFVYTCKTEQKLDKEVEGVGFRVVLASSVRTVQSSVRAISRPRVVRARTSRARARTSRELVVDPAHAGAASQPPNFPLTKEPCTSPWHDFLLETATN